MNKAKVIFMIIGGFIGLAIFMPGGKTEPVKEDPNTKVEQVKEAKLGIGDTGIINRFEDKTKCELVTALSVTKEDRDKLATTLEANDMEGLAIMILDGKAFVVDNCTKAKVIGRAMFVREVRILEGDATGMSGWLPVEWIRTIE